MHKNPYCNAAKLGYRGLYWEEQTVAEGDNMLQIVILICATSLSPAECQTNTALDVIIGPQANNPMMCGLQGQAYIARTAIVGRSPNEYVKIRCSPPKSTKAAAIERL